MATPQRRPSPRAGLPASIPESKLGLRQRASAAATSPAATQFTRALRSRAALRPLLLVDDDADALFLSERALRKGGVENPIVTAVGAEPAIAYLRSTCLAAGSPKGRKPAVIFLDIKMPDLDGFHVLRWIRRHRAFLKTKVIMLSHSDEERDIERARRLGADDCVMKYPKPAVMAALVRHALASPPVGR